MQTKPETALSTSPHALLRSAPLFPIALGLITGVTIDEWYQPHGLFYPSIITLCGAMSVSPFIRRRASGFVLLVLSACVGAWLHGATARTIVPESIALHGTEHGRLARIRGTVVDAPRISEPPATPFARWSNVSERSVFLVDVEAIEAPAGFCSTTGRVRVTVHEAILDLSEGESVELLGWLRLLPPHRNPGSFDWGAFYRIQGIECLLQCDHRENVRRLQNTADVSASSFAKKLRVHARRFLVDDLVTADPEQAGFLSAMVLGQRSQMDRRLNEAFTQAGCNHLLAASGTNVAIVMALVWGMGRILMLTKRRCVWLMLIAVGLYACIADPRPPILRATIMGVLFCLALLIRRPNSHLNWISAAAILLMLINPSSIFDAGFQLSFAAVLGVGFLSPALNRAASKTTQWFARRSGGDLSAELDQLRTDFAWRTRRRVSRGLWAAAFISFSAWLLTLPISSFYFQEIQPWGAVNTLVILPLISLVMGLGFAKLLLMAMWPSLGMMIGTPLSWVDAAILWLVHRMGDLPYSTIGLRAPSFWFIVLFYGFLLSLVICFRPTFVGTRSEPLPARTNPWHLNVLCLLLFAGVLLGFFGWYGPRSSNDRLIVTCLAVGRGTATVIELPDGQTVLYDVGGSGSYDVGSGTIIPFLRHRGITHVDRVWISHPNLDHFMGLPSLIEKFSTGPVVLNEYFSSKSAENSPSRYLLEFLSKRNHSIVFWPAKERMLQMGDTTFEILWPPPELPAYVAANDTSTVLRISYAGRSILLTGDIDEYAQRSLRSSADLQADVLMLPHHGSVRTSTRAFIKAVGATTVIRSSDERTEDTVNGLPNVTNQAILYNTADHGAVEVSIDKDGIRVTRFHP